MARKFLGIGYSIVAPASAVQSVWAYDFKRLPHRTTKIVVTFRCAPISIFKPIDNCNLHCNALVIAIQPEEGLDLHFEVKTPACRFTLKPRA
jgi:glucose-6-phosphate 1-dehydrogenase